MQGTYPRLAHQLLQMRAWMETVVRGYTMPTMSIITHAYSLYHFVGSAACADFLKALQIPLNLSLIIVREFRTLESK